jgi:hypothetical protein
MLYAIKNRLRGWTMLYVFHIPPIISKSRPSDGTGKCAKSPVPARSNLLTGVIIFGHFETMMLKESVGSLEGIIAHVIYT